MDSTTNTTPAGSSPAVVPAPAPVPAVTPTPAKPLTAAEIVAKASPAQRRDLALGRIKPSATPASVTPAAPAVVVPAAATPAPAATPAAAAAPETPATTPEGTAPATPGERPDRFRFKSDEDQAIALIAKERGVSLTAAVAIYTGTNANSATPAATPAAPVTPEVDPTVAGYDARVKELNTQVSQLTTQRTKHRDDLENDKADEISDKIADAKAELRLIENEKQGYIRNSETAARQSAQQVVAESRDRAYAKYPVLGDEESPHCLALQSYAERESRVPARAALFRQANWPEVIAEEYAQKYKVTAAGTAPVVTAPAAPAASPAAVLAAPVTRPAPQQVMAPSGARLLTGADGPRPDASSPVSREALAARIRNEPGLGRALIGAVGKLNTKR